MTFVRTIRGDIKRGDLGATSAHDYLICAGGPQVLADEGFLLDSVDKAVEEARYFMKAGGSAIVECCPVGLGRDIARLFEVNDRTPGLNIVVATGFHMGSYYADNRTHWVGRYSVDQISGLLIAEITQGIEVHDYTGPIVERSGARAGVIKVGTSGRPPVGP